MVWSEWDQHAIEHPLLELCLCLPQLAIPAVDACILADYCHHGLLQLCAASCQICVYLQTTMCLT
jgi:hypothetical protein